MCMMIQSSPLDVVSGGTGNDTIVPYAVVVGGTTTTGSLQSMASTGSSGQGLVSAGASAAPVWQTNVFPGYTAAGGFGYAGNSSVPFGASPNRTMIISTTVPASITSGAVDNTAYGYNALNAVASNTQCTAIGAQALEACTANNNTAVGGFALNLCTIGTENVAVGASCVLRGTGISYNTCAGTFVLNNASNAVNNSTIFGYNTCGNLTTSSDNNTIFSSQSLTSSAASQTRNSCFGAQNLNGPAGTTIADNVAIGFDALNTSKASQSIGIGYQAGNSATTGSNNIYIGYTADVVLSTESNRIAIGTSTHTAAYFYGARSGLSGASNVLINSASRLGTTTSAVRFKKNISLVLPYTASKLTDMVVVQFYYKNDPLKILQYGMIAEDVDSIFPETVVKNSQGNIWTIQYHKFIPLMIKYAQDEQREVKILQLKIKKLYAQLKKLKCCHL